MRSLKPISFSTSQDVLHFIENYKRNYQTRTRCNYSSLQQWSDALRKEIVCNPSTGLSYILFDNEGSSSQISDQIQDERTALLPSQKRKTLDNLVPNLALAEALIYYDEHKHLFAFAQKAEEGLFMLLPSGETVSLEALIESQTQDLFSCTKNFKQAFNELKKGDVKSLINILCPDYDDFHITYLNKDIHGLKIYFNKPLIALLLSIEAWNIPLKNKIYGQLSQYRNNLTDLKSMHIKQAFISLMVICATNVGCFFTNMDLKNLILSLGIAAFIDSRFSKSPQSPIFSLGYTALSVTLLCFIIKNLLLSSISSFYFYNMEMDSPSKMLAITSLQMIPLLLLYEGIKDGIEDIQRIIHRHKSIASINTLLPKNNAGIVTFDNSSELYNAHNFALDDIDLEAQQISLRRR